MTGADLSSDGRRLAVLTYHAIFVFERPPGEAPSQWLSGASHRIGLVQPITQQCEAIAWDGDQLLVTNEGRAVMRLATPLAETCRTFPGPGCG